ncbi:MAG TPA: hypothetical protein VFE62_02360 [Gemmataceae bacterium]|nr:hypothetical protein [Gemmataceae bacterium]
MTRIVAILTLLACITVASADPCKSGPQPNQRTGPYSALVCVGKERGTQHCYVCESAAKPVVIVFARTLNEPLGKLVKKLDDAIKKEKAADLRAWVTILGDDQTKMDPLVVKWAQQHAIGLPCAVFEDTVGPPAYLLAKEADVTVLLALKQKVVANFAFRAGELNDSAIADIVKALPKIAVAPAKK